VEEVEDGIVGRLPATLRVVSRTVHANDQAQPLGDQGSSGGDLDLVAIGNPLLDVIDTITEAELARLELEKGSMTLIDLAKATAVQAAMTGPRFVSGGSVANTAAGVAVLGGSAGYIGAVADDEEGRTYTEQMRVAGVEFLPALSASTDGEALGTGRCVVLVTDDADRTMGTYLGAASTLTPSGVSSALIERADIVLLEGYLWDVPAAKEAMRHASQVAHGANGSVALSLSDPFCVGRHQREFLDLLVDDIDILLGNEEEITMLFGAGSYNDALEAAEETGLLVVMTRGAQGAVVLTAHGPEEVAAAPVPKVVDTTGAGDLFAAGFLYGLTHGMDPVESTGLAGLCAAEVISHVGARPEADLRQLALAAGLLPSTD
jgi:sugar/nucleoside kinase (ribokinase family)